jgi:hypothetical protein
MRERGVVGMWTSLQEAPGQEIGIHACLCTHGALSWKSVP